MSFTQIRQCVPNVWVNWNLKKYRSLKSSLKGKYGLENFISVERTFRQEFENNCRFVQFGTEPREMQLKQINSTSPSTEMKIDIVS